MSVVGGFRPIALALALVLVLATFALALAGTASAYITSTDCGVVAPYGVCYTPYASWGDGGRRTLFRLVNGDGVLHTAYIYDVYHQGTAQDVYSPCISLSGSLRGSGKNNSASGHYYKVAQTTYGC